MTEVRNTYKYLHGRFPNRKKNGPPEKEKRKSLMQKVRTIAKGSPHHHVSIPLSKLESSKKKFT